jgi:hypothetical protein
MPHATGAIPRVQRQRQLVHCAKARIEQDLFKHLLLKDVEI